MMNEPSPAQRLYHLSEDFFKKTLEFYPGLASGLGLHQYDGLAPDLSEPSRAHRSRLLRSLIRELEEPWTSALAGQSRWDRLLLLVSARNELFRLVDLDLYGTNPMEYVWLLDVSNYIKRDYAPLTVRGRGLSSYLSQMPRLVADMIANLRKNLALPVVEAAVQALEGVEAFYHRDLPAALDPLKNSGQARELEQSRAAAVESVRRLIAWMKEKRKGPPGEFAIGQENFSNMLKFGEMVDMSLDKALTIGREDLARNLDRLHEAAAAIDKDKSPGAVLEAVSKDHPTADELIPHTLSVLEEIRQFIIDHDLITVPSEVRCRVTETPSFMRWAFAALDAPGPFEEVASEAFYYITPVEPHWTSDQAEAWLREFSYPAIKNVSIHEAYPGHYVQILHSRTAPSKISKVFRSYAFSEGWGHYAEELMQEAGYGDGDPRLRMAQIADALTRDCRYICSILMHTGEMSVEQATRFFMENAYMEELPAGKEALRGTFDPGYLNYTLGKLLLLKLRRDYKKEMGAAFTMRRFHDAVLSFGEPPIPLLRQQMLREPGEEPL